MGFRLYTQSAAVIAQLRRDQTATCIEIAEKILRCSQSKILGNPYQEGVALGAGAREADLAASGYLATAKASGYEAAKTRAGHGARDRWAPQVRVGQGTSEFRVKVAFALDRATLMHDGYYDPRADKFMDGVPFLRDCTNGYGMLYKRMSIANCRQLQSIQETRSLIQQGDYHARLSPQAQQEAYEQQELSAVRRATQQETQSYSYSQTGNPLGVNPNDWMDFKEAYSDDSRIHRRKIREKRTFYREAHNRRTKGGEVRFVRGGWVTGIVTVWEDYNEWVSRLEDLFHHFKDPSGFGR